MSETTFDPADTRASQVTTLPEPPDGTRIEFESNTDVYAAWRDDESSRRAGWSHGDGGEVWCLYGYDVPATWAELVETYGEESLRLAVRLVPHPDDVVTREQWPTQVWARRHPNGDAL